jgi:transposase
MKRFWDSSWRHDSRRLSSEDRADVIALARDGSAAHRLARRANALVLLDAGWNCEKFAGALLLDDDTIRKWRDLFVAEGIEGLARFEAGCSACQLNGEQQEKLTAWVGAALPRSTRQIGAWIEKEFGLVYESRSGPIALLHRLGLEYHKPDAIPRKLDEAKQKTFIESYDDLLNSLADNEAVVFADAVHLTHAARAAGCWAPRQEKLAIEQTSGRQRINIHDAIDLEIGQPSAGYSNRLRLLEPLTRFAQMIEALTIDAASTIQLLESIEALYPMLVLIHVFLDNARYHHPPDHSPGVVREWLAQPGCRIKLLMSLPNDHPALLPAPEPDRAAMGPHAQTCHAQQMLRHMRTIRGRHARFLCR